MVPFEGWAITECLVVFGLAVAVALYFGYRAASKEGCLECGQEQGVRYHTERVGGEENYEIYRRYRVCKNCGSRILMKEFKKRNR